MGQSVSNVLCLCYRYFMQHSLWLLNSHRVWPVCRTVNNHKHRIGKYPILRNPARSNVVYRDLSMRIDSRSDIGMSCCRTVMSDVWTTKCSGKYPVLRHDVVCHSTLSFMVLPVVSCVISIVAQNVMRCIPRVTHDSQHNTWYDAQHMTIWHDIWKYIMLISCKRLVLC